MPHFDKPAMGVSSPVGRKQYLRSSRGIKYESYTAAAGAFTAEDYINGNGETEKIKVLQSGEVIAKITSGPNAGKYGPAQLGATDGRADAANFVGLSESYIPWQLNERDVDISVVYEATAVQAWCTIRDATGARIPLTDTVADGLRGKKGLQITFK
ncbi:capsid decoration protein [Gordonia phage Jumbo]|uniref:Capsid decoration protein n=1 Tax=Gordonia phage Jumbo TaxID=1887650 RepID=A0A1B3B0J5_9CAUD|nr:head decoration [Gordonia phage Jumbo]AOE44524.1 capsid decoration protein [Gordonia phage Jumbo]